MGRGLRRFGFVAVLVAVAIAMTAPPGGSSQADLEQVRASAEHTLAQRSARIAGVVDTTTIDGKTIHIPVNGKFDFQHGRGIMNVDFAQIPELKNVEVPGFTLLFVNDSIYIEIGSLLNVQDVPKKLEGKRWVEEKVPQYGGSESVTGVPSSDPTASLAALRGVSDIQLVGSQPVRRVMTDHYRGVVDVKAAIDAVPPEDRAVVEGGMVTFGSTLPIDVWLDRDGVVRKVAMTLSALGPGGVYVESRTEMEYYDFGTRVSVTAPPRRQVIDYAEFQKIMTRAGGTTSGQGSAPTV